MNFNDVLNTPVEDIRRPPLPPIGSYKMGVIKTDIREQPGRDKSWGVIDFTLRGIAPQDDVDMDDMRAYGDAKNIVQRRSFMFERGGDEASLATTLFNLKRFVTEHLNIEWPDGQGVKQILPKCINAVCIANIQYNPDKNDPDLMHANIKSTTSAQ